MGHFSLGNNAIIACSTKSRQQLVMIYSTEVKPFAEGGGHYKPKIGFLINNYG